MRSIYLISSCNYSSTTDCLEEINIICPIKLLLLYQQNEFMIKWNRNGGVLESHLSICANIAVQTCGNLERGLESEAVWEMG